MGELSYINIFVKTVGVARFSEANADGVGAHAEGDIGIGAADDVGDLWAADSMEGRFSPGDERCLARDGPRRPISNLRHFDLDTTPFPFALPHLLNDGFSFANKGL